MIRLAAKTNTGKVRENNEDNYLLTQNRNGDYLVVVADGMGGHKAGEVASKMACNILQNSFEKLEGNIDYKSYISEIVSTANEQIYTRALFNEEYENMGTTISLVIVTKDKLYTGHVGDSRIYHVSKDDVIQLTKDHTLVQMLIDNGTMKSQDVKKSNYKNVLIQAVGTSKKLTVEIREFKLPSELMLLLTTDGLSDKASEKKIHEIITQLKTEEEVLEELIEYGLQVDGTDNITVALVKKEQK